MSNWKISKKGFLAGAPANMVVYVIMIFIIISFHLVFLAIEERNNDIISFDNEPIFLAETLLHSFLDSEVETTGIECLGDNKSNVYRYSVKEMLIANYNECNVKDMDKIQEIGLYDDPDVDYEIVIEEFEDSSASGLEIIVLSSSLPRCDEKDAFASDAYVFLPIKDGILKVQAIVKEYDERLKCR